VYKTLEYGLEQCFIDDFNMLYYVNATHFYLIQNNEE